MKNILFVHQSAELYGSDKALLLLVSRFKEKNFNPIVVLPAKGPLYDKLEETGIKIIVTPVMKLSRKMFTPKNLINFPFQIKSSTRYIDRQLEGLKIDLVYSNTLAVLLGLTYSKKKRLKHIWHVHEIIKKPDIVRTIFKYLLKLKTNTAIIYNSFATKSFWEGDVTRQQSHVVWNGLEYDQEQSNASASRINEIRSGLFKAHSDDVVIALIGRISHLKGQQLLLEAFNKLQPKYGSLKLVYVGSTPPNQEIHLTKLNEKIKEYHLGEKAIILPFQNNISEIWAAVDIALVPSTQPESFGLVALEAMLAKKPVIASNHGGITEIVVDNVTGLLFEPGSVSQLQHALEGLINDKAKRQLMGQKGYERAITEFTLQKYVDGIEKICLAV